MTYVRISHPGDGIGPRDGRVQVRPPPKEATLAANQDDQMVNAEGAEATCRDGGP